MIKRKKGPKPPAKGGFIDLHPSEWDRDWQPPIGNHLLPGERPHIWQEFKRDLNMRRESGEPFIGRGWPILAIVIAIIAIQTVLSIEGGPAWLIAVKNLF